MSAYVGTRDKHQCRSHDQKIRKNPKNFDDFLERFSAEKISSTNQNKCMKNELKLSLSESNT